MVCLLFAWVKCRKLYESNLKSQFSLKMVFLLKKKPQRKVFNFSDLYMKREK